MSKKKPYDATARKLIEMGPPDWAAYLGNPVADPDRVKAIDSNISTVTAEADKVLWIEDPKPWIMHIELQAGRDVNLEDRAHMYSASCTLIIRSRSGRFWSCSGRRPTGRN